MKWLSLAFEMLLQNRRRTALTMSAIVLALFIFVTLQTILSAMQLRTTEGEGEVRMAVLERYGGPRSELPISYARDLRSFEHVVGMSPLNFTIVGAGSGGTAGPYYITFAVDPEGYRDVFPRLGTLVPEEQYACFVKTRNGVLVGRDILVQQRWKVGDNIQLRSLLHQSTLDVVVCGELYDPSGTQGNVGTQIIVNRAYYANATDKEGLVNMFWLRLDRPASVAGVIRAVTEHFAEGPFEVSVQSEGALLARMSQFSASIQLVLRVVSIAVLFTIFIVTANTIALSMRERKREIAVMKAVGYTPGLVLGLVVLEATLTSLLAGLVGTTLAWLLFQFEGVTLSFGVAYDFAVTPSVVAVGMAIALALGVVSGVVPAYRASRVNVIQALQSL